MLAIPFAMFLSTVSAAPELLPSSPAVALDQARVDEVRLVTWELAGGAGIEAQLLDANTHEALSQRFVLGTDSELRFGGVQTRPATAGLRHGDETVFVVAWHAELLDANGNSIGTDVVAQRLVLASDMTLDIGHAFRVSGYDDDTDPSAGSESRSAPVVVAHPLEQEFLVLWTHWPDGKQLQNEPPVTVQPLSIMGHEIPANGDVANSSVVRLDTMSVPERDGAPARYDLDVIFLAAVPRIDASGYLLAWSDPAQESGSEDLAQIYTKLLPENIASTRLGERVPHVDSVDISEGTGRIALTALPDESGYLLAFEDMRGKAPLNGLRLELDGTSSGEPVRLLDRMQTGDHAFLSPQFTREGDGLVLYAAVGDRPLDAATGEATLKNGRLVRRSLDAAALSFNPIFEDFETVLEDYAPVSLYFALQAYAVGTFPEMAGSVAFSIVPDEARIRVDEHKSTHAPVAAGNDTSGGGSGNPLVLLACWFVAVRGKRAATAVALAAVSLPALSAPPDVELLHSTSDGTDCYRAVMYREVKEIHLGKRWGENPLPPEPRTEIVDLPAAWQADVLTESDHQYVRLRPSGFDVVTGFAIGKVCLKLPQMTSSAVALPYTYELTATGSRISATSRKDNGLSEDQLRALANRAERLKRAGETNKPKELEEKLEQAKRLKDLFN